MAEMITPATATAEELIRALYDKDYLVNPKVTLTTTGHAAQFAAITGAEFVQDVAGASVLERVRGNLTRWFV